MPGLICKFPVFAWPYIYHEKIIILYIGFLLPPHSTAFIVTDVPFWQAANVAQCFHH